MVLLQRVFLNKYYNFILIFLFNSEPKNFSIEMEFLFVNNILEGFFIYWGEVSSVSYQETINYLFHILYPLPYIQKDEEAIKKQQILLQEKFLKHGLRIFQKVMFSYKHDEKNKNLHDILFSLMSYMLNNNLITFRDAKFFPFFKKLITSSLKSLHSHRKISSGSKEKIFFFDDSSSLLERSNYSRNKNNPSSEKNLVSNEDLDKINLSYKKQNIRKNICKELSFKTSQSLKIKDSWFPSSKSKEFNLVLRSLDSDAEMEFSSYSGEEKDSEIEIETFGHHYRVKKVETLKKAFKNSMSFSFD